MHGQYAPQFEPLVREWAATVEGRGAGSALAVYQRGKPAVDVWIGERDRGGAPWERDTPCVAYSTTKGVVATAIHILVDRGLVEYDRPIAFYWPRFTADVTVRDLLTHRAGLYDVRRLVDHARDLLDWDGMLARLERATPQVRGPRSSYHGITFGYLAGGIVEKVTGVRLQEFVESAIAKPLGLDHFYVQTPEAARRVAARLRVSDFAAKRDFPPRWFRPPIPFAQALLPPGMYDFDVSRDEVMAACIPSSNGVFTARALARMYAALANGGELDGVRLMAPETVRAAATVQNTRPDAVVFFPMRWRLGYHLAATSRGVLPNGFGHFGYGGSGAWCDPDSQLAVAFTTNTLAGTPFGDSRLLRLGALARACARRR
ncbi:MAG: serine hydrolase domain-containing protein [Polyangiales bacterium]